MHGWLVFGSPPFAALEIVELRLSPRTVEFHCSGFLPGGLIIPSPCPAQIQDPDGALVYRYEYAQGQVKVPDGPPQRVGMLQTLSLLPDDGPIRVHGWREPRRTELPRPGAALPPSPRSIER